MRTIFYYEIYARHDVIIESACVWLEDVKINTIQISNLKSYCRVEINSNFKQPTQAAKGTKEDIF